MTSDIQIPPEWAKQSAIWVGWPTLEEEWGEAFHLARGEIATFVHVLSGCIPVHIAAGSEEAATNAETQCGSVAKIHQIPLGDIWLRDTGPIIAMRNGKPVALQFRFDGWGGKFVMPGDTETSAAIAQSLELSSVLYPFVLEGGAIEMDGAGRLITTRQCLLDGVRNSSWNETEAESALKTALGAAEIIWLERGLANDHTDGHVDNLARFIGPSQVVCQTPAGEDDPNADVFADIETVLREAGLTVSTIPSPGRIERHGKIIPASHLNFLMTSGKLILPTFEETHAPRAMEELAKILPDWEIVALPASQILSGGGTFHCMTRDIPDISAWEAKS